jgi:hypothetical protein
MFVITRKLALEHAIQFFTVGVNQFFTVGVKQ